ncbi:hypothetical protein NXK88_002783 [Enterococcus hirae]|uniref:hypothetical protein n=1 Tax=Enterococcus hirae TaxID=1354 RepID=UPI00207418A8|nr:hypothetical protein [Enterococcus hirae]EMF0203500.1 hypothetical protein [Enterococcus hirae]
MQFLLGAMPTFPTVDLSEQINWLVDGFGKVVASNAGLVVGAAIAMALLPVAIKKVVSFAKSALRS